MIRIRVDDQPTATTFYIEGKLVGNSVEELRRVWEATQTEDLQKQTIIELSSVLLIDAPGRTLLRQMFAKGARLAGNGIMIRALIGEIADGNSRAGESGFLLVPER